MKQAISSTTLFQLIIAFTLLFSAFLAVAITYNRVFKLKNEAISIIEKYEGVSNKSIKIINNYLTNSGYHTLGTCEDGEFGISDLYQDSYELASNNKKYYYCLNNYCQTGTCKVNDLNAPNGNQIFYSIRLFFKFNLPFIGDLMTFSIDGETKAVQLYDENQKLKER